MPRTRQPSDSPSQRPRAESLEERRIVVRTSAVGFSSDYQWSDRRSEWGQLLWASRGAISVTISGTLWLVPTREALWLPPGVAHHVQMTGRGILRALYLRRAHCRSLPRDPRTLPFGRLLREIIRRIVERDTMNLDLATDAHLVAVLRDELIAHFAHPAPPLDLPLPVEPRALRAAQIILAAPGEALPLAILARQAAASPRTLERLFARDTTMSLGAWRQRAALIHGIRTIAEGKSVTQAALAAGYSSTSAFIAAIKRLTGRTPGQQRRDQA